MKELQDQINFLTNKVNSLENSQKISVDVERALRNRLGLNSTQNVTLTYVTSVSLINLGGGNYSISYTTKTATFTNGILTSTT